MSAPGDIPSTRSASSGRRSATRARATYPAQRSETPNTDPATLPEGVTVLVACGVRLYREGLAMTLEQHAAFRLRLVGTACDAEQTLEQVRLHRPAVILLDAGLVTSVVTRLRDLSPETQVVVLAVTESNANVIAIAEAGVAGYVPRDGSRDDLLAAIERAGRGEVLCPPYIVASLFRHMAAVAGQRTAGVMPGLTTREQEIVALLGKGMTNKEIARRLTIRVATVKNHVHSILQKLGVTRRFAVMPRLMGRDD